MSIDLTYAWKTVLHVVNATTTWDAADAHKWTVPAGKRWFVFGGQVYRDASETLAIRAYTALDAHILTLSSQGAATTTTSWPDSGLNTWGGLLPLDAGEYINFAFGGNQSTTAWISGWAMEIDIQ